MNVFDVSKRITTYRVSLFIWLLGNFTCLLDTQAFLFALPPVNSSVLMYHGRLDINKRRDGPIGWLFERKPPFPI